MSLEEHKIAIVLYGSTLLFEKITFSREGGRGKFGKDMKAKLELSSSISHKGGYHTVLCPFSTMSSYFDEAAEEGEPEENELGGDPEQELSGDDIQNSEGEHEERGNQVRSRLVFYSSNKFTTRCGNFPTCNCVPKLIFSRIEVKRCFKQGWRVKRKRFCEKTGEIRRKSGFYLPETGSVFSSGFLSPFLQRKPTKGFSPCLLSAASSPPALRQMEQWT